MVHCLTSLGGALGSSSNYPLPTVQTTERESVSCSVICGVGGWLEDVCKVCEDASYRVAITRSLLWSGIAVGSGCCGKYMHERCVFSYHCCDVYIWALYLVLQQFFTALSCVSIIPISSCYNYR